MIDFNYFKIGLGLDSSNMLSSCPLGCQRENRDTSVTDQATGSTSKRAPQPVQHQARRRSSARPWRIDPLRGSFFEKPHSNVRNTDGKKSGPKIRLDPHKLIQQFLGAKLRENVSNISGIDLPSITWAFQFRPKFDGGHFQTAVFPYWQIQMLDFLVPSMHVHAVYPTIVTPNSTPNLHGKSSFLWGYITPSSHNPSIFLGDKPW